MSGRKKHDWPGLIAEYVAIKAREPLLTQNEFFRRKGISPPAGNRKIGKKMTLAWEESREKALSHVVKKSGLNLGEELERQFRAAKTAFTVGARYILPRVSEDGTEIPALLQPTTLAEALMLMKTGGDAMREIAKILAGDKPIIPPTPDENKSRVVLYIPSNGKERAGTEIQHNGEIYIKKSSYRGMNPDA